MSAVTHKPAETVATALLAFAQMVSAAKAEFDANPGLTRQWLVYYEAKQAAYKKLIEEVPAVSDSKDFWRCVQSMRTEDWLPIIHRQISGDNEPRPVAEAFVPASGEPDFRKDKSEPLKVPMTFTELDKKVWGSLDLTPEPSEQYLARKYCAPVAYWHCLHELQGNGYAFADVNLPEHWLKAVEQYCGHQPSKAAKRLCQQVEDARAKFRAAQARFYGHQPEREKWNLPDRSKLGEIYRKEDSAWERFNARKEQAFRDYLKAVKTGEVKKRKRRRGKQCAGEDCDERLFGRKKYCKTCAKQRHREAVRACKLQKQSCRVINSPWEIRPKKGPFGYFDPLRPKNGTFGHLKYHPENATKTTDELDEL